MVANTHYSFVNVYNCTRAANITRRNIYNKYFKEYPIFTVKECVHPSIKKKLEKIIRKKINIKISLLMAISSLDRALFMI